MEAKFSLVIVTFLRPWFYLCQHKARVDHLHLYLPDPRDFPRVNGVAPRASLSRG